MSVVVKSFKYLFGFSSGESMTPQFRNKFNKISRASPYNERVMYIELMSCKLTVTTILNSNADMSTLA